MQSKLINNKKKPKTFPSQMCRVEQLRVWIGRMKNILEAKLQFPLGCRRNSWTYWENKHRSWAALTFKANCLQGGKTPTAYTEQMQRIACCRYLQGHVYTQVTHPRLCLKPERKRQSQKGISMVVPMNEW